MKNYFTTLWLLLFPVMMALGAQKQFTLVVDAGHGGYDTGAIGKISKEKNLTLKFALAFGKMVEQNCPDVKVVYTRTTDIFVPLVDRAEIANKAKADLFISVHINALPKGHVARGFQTYTLGKGQRSGTGFMQNLEVAKRENSVILLEKNYKATYKGYDPNSPASDILFEFIQDKNMENSVELARLMQKHVCAATGRQNMGAHQDNLAVLRLSSMPGCLLELGFISTPDEEEFMNSSDAASRYARGIYNAFIAYRQKYDSRFKAPATIMQPQPEEQQSEKPKVYEIAKPKEEAPKAEPQKPATVEKQDTTSVKTVEEKPEVPTVETDKPVFKVQILASTTRLKPTDRQFGGLSGVESYEEGGFVKYTVGSSTNYNEISKLRKEVAEKFPQAFIIAFKNGEKMNTSQAIQEFKANKTKQNTK